MKENYYRSVVITSLTEEQFKSLPEFGNWITGDDVNSYGIKRKKFQNEVIGAEVLFDDSKPGYWKSVNVLPIDGSNHNAEEYEKGFDTANNQAVKIEDDVLYDFCKAFNKMARQENEGTDNYWWCAIIPSVNDCV